MDKKKKSILICAGIAILQQEKAKKILKEHMEKLHVLAKKLYEKEVMNGEEFMSFLNSSL